MVEAFSAGADDYVTKPFSFRQLVLRVNAVSPAQCSQVASNELVLPGLTINPDTWCVTHDGGLLNLTRIEFRILYCLASHFGRVTPTDRLLRYVWSDEGGDSNVLKTHLSHIRQKFARDRHRALDHCRPERRVHPSHRRGSRGRYSP